MAEARARCIVVGISGAIATGKTAFAHRLSEALGDAALASEDVGENPFLSSFYGDMRRWAFHHRIAMLEMKLRALVGARDSARYIVLDRPVHELVTFARMHRDLGILTPDEFGVFERLHVAILALVPALDCVVHVHCAAEIALQRIAARGRPFEQEIDLDYLRRIPTYYREWLDGDRPAPSILEIDSSIETPDGSLAKTLTRLRALSVECA
jgi:deoxyadenosine/deoxycytidine kinase